MQQFLNASTEPLAKMLISAHNNPYGFIAVQQLGASLN